MPRRFAPTPESPRLRHALVLEAVYFVVLAHLTVAKRGLVAGETRNPP